MRLGRVAAVVLVGIGLSTTLAQEARPAKPKPVATQLFATADRCMACHNQLTTPAGEDVSLGIAWRASMMANSARDPYWQASVRREVIDLPSARAAIEDECSICHMPAATFAARAKGQRGQIFSPLASGAALATDGVTCTVCHQIRADNFGRTDSFTGNFLIDTREPRGRRAIFGPYQVDPGRTRIMRSATHFEQVQSAHVQASELCATCHTLFTHPRDASGRVIGRFPEQVPYLEWLHSEYRASRSCQSCHMPEIDGEVPISSVLGQPRARVSRHDFVGGNFFMLRMLGRYASELGVKAPPGELVASAAHTEQHLKTQAARLRFGALTLSSGVLRAEVVVQNLAGHKLPTAYPSRRAWLHFVVRDAHGALRFESGRMLASGAISGNANDADPLRFEPHYTTIEQPDQVQIYESIMTRPDGQVTTGLLTATRYAKDNRLLPRGFDKARAQPDIAVRGAALADPDFTAGGDTVTYRVGVGDAPSPLRIRVELCYQPIAFRWAENLARYDAAETRKFVRYYRSMSLGSSAKLAELSASVGRVD